MYLSKISNRIKDGRTDIMRLPQRVKISKLKTAQCAIFSLLDFPDSAVFADEVDGFILV